MRASRSAVDSSVYAWPMTAPPASVANHSETTTNVRRCRSSRMLTLLEKKSDRYLDR